MTYVFLLLTLFILIRLYFSVAEQYQIIDKPNQRSSHAIPTVRGGGIIFPITTILWFVYSGFEYPFFVSGMILISIISFADDVGEQSAARRSLVQLIAFLLMAYQTDLFFLPVGIVLFAIVIGIGSLNAFNFMDGINGISGIYALVNIVSFYIINRYLFTFVDESILFFMLTAVVVFLFFNFRKKARCFAGDVGSVSLAFFQLFNVLLLINTTETYGWILLFMIYGLDTVVTIIYRLRNRENIFKAHRSHLFQYFSNELGISHLWVSVLFGVAQLGVNACLFIFLMSTPYWFSFVFLFTGGIFYFIIRESVLKKIGMRGLIVNRKAA